jgi:hypothetical protein
MHNPVEEVILDAGAANQQGNGVNENAHAGEHSSPWLVVVLRPVLAISDQPSPAASGKVGGEAEVGLKAEYLRQTCAVPP